MKMICEHCGAESSAGMHKRWHGDNCKQKPSTNQSHVEVVSEEIEVPVVEKTENLISKGENRMSTFIEVNSVEKGCQVIINLDHVVEITPLAAGGCVLFFTDGTGKYDIKVTDNYTMFRQFAMQTVSADDIARKIASLKG